jgi:thimet oligopeptidase
MNILFDYTHPNIPFSTLTSEVLNQQYTRLLQTTRDTLAEIHTAQSPLQTNALWQLDTVFNNLGKLSGLLYIVGFAHPDEALRQTAMEAIDQVEQFANTISLDEKLYQTLKRLDESPEKLQLAPDEVKFLDDTLRDMERNGLALGQEERDAIIELKNQLTTLGTEFETNIASADEQLCFSAEELDGLPETYKEARVRPDGSYVIDLSYPSYRPFMKYAHNDAARKRLMVAFFNRAAQANDPILHAVVELRKQLAQKLGFKSYAEFTLKSQLAASPEAVWEFEHRLLNQLKEKAQQDQAQLLAKKSAYTQTLAQEINLWESSYWETKVLNEDFGINQEEIKQYFSLQNVINGIFEIVSTLFDVRIQTAETADVWHPEVQKYEIRKGAETIGIFYLDMYPRKNKYSHAAMFPIVPGRKLSGAAEIPQAALVCNFPPATASQPSLLTHSDVETLFHEFGHLIHGLFTQTPLAAQSGTGVCRDFVETPSQMFEHWAWEYESLQNFATHYQTHEPLPKALHQKMVAARNVNSGNHNLQQLFYGMLDMQLHDKWESKHSIPEIVEKLQNEITNYPFVEGTNFHANFGHLIGYAAGYYGYLWAKVYAVDFFSKFQSEGILNPKTGQEYLQKVLSKGSSVPEAETVSSFLGREADIQAFLHHIGLKG